MNVDDEHARFLALIQDVSAQQAELQTHVTKVTAELQEHSHQPEDRNSLLDLKLQLMSRYLTNLGLIAIRKTTPPCKLSTQPEHVLRLAELRTVIEKIRPIEGKLQYMFDKLLQSAEKTGDSGQMSSDPLSFKPRPDDMLVDEGDNEGEAESSEQEERDSKAERSTGTGKYVPPRLAEVHYFESQREAGVERSRQARKEAISRGILEDLRATSMDVFGAFQGPEEISESALAGSAGGNLANALRRKLIKQHQERVDYEEDRMMRLQVTKKDKKRNKALANLGAAALETVADFREYEQLLNDSSSAKRKGQKGGGKKKGAKKGSRKRKFKIT